MGVFFFGQKPVANPGAFPICKKGVKSFWGVGHFQNLKMFVSWLMPDELDRWGLSGFTPMDRHQYPYGSHRIAYNRTAHAPATNALETRKSLSNARFPASLHVSLIIARWVKQSNPLKKQNPAPSTQRTQHQGQFKRTQAHQVKPRRTQAQQMSQKKAKQHPGIKPQKSEAKSKKAP